MLSRIAVVALNAYREAVRARLLHGLLALALGTCAYSMVVASMSLQGELRVIADVGAASISLYALVVAVVVGATSLHRELELKTIFPVLTRPIARHEYVLGKYLGIVLTIGVFIALDGAAVLALAAIESGVPSGWVGAVAAILVGLGIVIAWRAKHTRVFVLIPWALAAFLAMALLSKDAGDERQLVLASCALTLLEALIVTGVALFFSSFSSPVLTAVFTLGVVVVGRSADMLAHLPPRVFGESLTATGRLLAKVVPNLQLFVPPRPVLLGHVADTPTWSFVLAAGGHALAFSCLLVATSALIFRRRDFQ